MHVNLAAIDLTNQGLISPLSPRYKLKYFVRLRNCCKLAVLRQLLCGQPLRATWRLCVAFGNAGVELLFAVEGLLGSLWHRLRLFAALRMYCVLNNKAQGWSLSSGDILLEVMRSIRVF